jgi:hypothetical protein
MQGACFHVIVKTYRYSLEERVFIVKAYWITGSIKNCQRRFVEQFGGRNLPSKRCIQLLVKKLIFSFFQLPFCEFPKNTTALHYRYDMQMYCTFVLFVNHFPGLPASGTHCINLIVIVDSEVKLARVGLACRKGRAYEKCMRCLWGEISRETSARRIEKKE